MQLEPPVLDPTANPAAAISEVLYGNVFEGLVQFAADGSVLPRLAAFMGNLGRRPDLRISSGSAACAFTTAATSTPRPRSIPWSASLAPGSINPQRSRLRAIRAVEVVDPLPCGCCSSRRSGGLLQSLAFGSAVMVSRASAANNARAAHRHGSVSILTMAARRLDHPGAQSGLSGPARALGARSPSNSSPIRPRLMPR